MDERALSGRVGGRRNFGYGKRMDWAGVNALKQKYRGGHFATVAAHVDHWRLFCRFARAHGVKDSLRVTRALVESYAEHLAASVRSGALAASYAQNLLCSVNVVLRQMRGDRQLTVSPRAWVGVRPGVRSEAPRYLDRAEVERIQGALCERAEQRLAAQVGLARELMLRFKESALLDARAALREALQTGQVSITAGTKGGRGKSRDPAVARRVPVGAHGLAALREAAHLQGSARNLIPGHLSYAQWREHCYFTARKVGMTGFHDLRAAGACERYREITGFPAPVVAGAGPQAPHALDRAARRALMPMLGHSALRAAAHYLGAHRG